MKIIYLLTLLIGSVLMLSVKAENHNNRNLKQADEVGSTAKLSPGMEHLAPIQDLPFSEAVRAGEMIYLSGMLGMVPGTRNLAPGGVKAETKQIMDNMRTLLERNGSALNRVVKCTVILADIKEWAGMNEVYATYFEKGRFPARTAFGSNGLLFGARVEIECLALMKPEVEER